MILRDLTDLTSDWENARSRMSAMRRRLCEEDAEAFMEKLQHLAKRIELADELISQIQSRSASHHQLAEKLEFVLGSALPTDLRSKLHDFKSQDWDGDRDAERARESQSQRVADRHAYPRTPEWQRAYNARMYLLVQRDQKPNLKRWDLLRVWVEDLRHSLTNERTRVVEERDRIVNQRVEQFARVVVPGFDIARVSDVESWAANCIARDDRALAASELWVAKCCTSASVREIVHLTRPILSAIDLELCGRWGQRGENSRFEQDKQRSARAAEVAMLQLYQRLFGHAEDLSVLQATCPGDVRWERADIQVHQRLVDVKNSRTSYSSPRSYSEHCIPRTKVDHRGQDVAISGVLSPYSVESDDPLVWLGETSETEIQLLRAEFEKPELQISFDRNGIAFFPPWLFDYPSTVYESRDTMLRVLRSESWEWPLSPCSSKLAVLAPDTSFAEGRAQLGSELVHLRNRLSRFEAPTRPILFLHVIDRFGATMRCGSRFPFEELRACLFGGPLMAPVYDMPLCVYDPLATVHGLLGVLRTVSERCQEQGLQFVGLRLRGMNVLEGMTRQGRWQTIVAYCGGWRAVGATIVRCGRVPLCLGEDEPCPDCRRLICSSCGYCGSQCSRYRGWQNL